MKKGKCEMGIPQIAMIVLFALSLWQNFEKHGEPRGGSYDFGAALVAIALESGLLYWGGFFG